MTDIEYRVHRLQARFDELLGAQALWKQDVADLRTELRDITRRQWQDFRLPATVILVITWIVVFVLMAKGFGWVH